MIGTILLTKTNVYVKEDKSLPKRPDFDKGLLTAVLKGQTVSMKAWQLLPPSMQKTVKVSDIADSTMPVTIRELAQADILIVVRSKERCKGKKFRLDKFECILKTEEIELWQRISDD